MSRARRASTLQRRNSPDGRAGLGRASGWTYIEFAVMLGYNNALLLTCLERTCAEAIGQVNEGHAVGKLVIYIINCQTNHS
jgi:hypothetical protein